ncbi:GCN5-related N-acetyltransferase [Streptomyces bingchenggensis BCW-1]|uniref:GCN5-related N-acetyltransferase n=1 Tax=Streptomyces bingchenggensis (strain BCW-1) TaxID=749414 RepID=D7BQ56_STRBB|nr:GCN5-related N-acetyltransferase [Streptomyces bingchenggensis BCW-1]
MKVNEVKTSTDLDAIVDTLTAAFLEDDPVVNWLIPPGTPERERYLRGFLRAWVKFMLDHEGTAIVTADHSGVLIWEPSPSGRKVPLTAEDEEAFLADIAASTGPAEKRCLQLIEALDSNYPRDLPRHGHVALAAVHPEARGTDARTALTDELVRLAVSLDLGGYCEASSERNALLWERLGMQRIGEPIQLPESDVTLTPMFIPPPGVQG